MCTCPAWPMLQGGLLGVPSSTGLGMLLWLASCKPGSAQSGLQGLGTGSIARGDALTLCGVNAWCEQSLCLVGIVSPS